VEHQWVDDRLDLPEQVFVLVNGVQDAADGSDAANSSQGRLAVIVVGVDCYQALVGVNEVLGQLQGMGADVV
jgi:hypothetical protein